MIRKKEILELGELLGLESLRLMFKKGKQIMVVWTCWA